MPELSSLFDMIWNFVLMMLRGGPEAENYMFSVLFGGSFLCAGSLCLFFGALLALRAVRAQSWPTTNGIILSSHVASSTSSEGGTSYRPAVHYQYQVEERTYNNDLIAFGARNYYGGYGGAQKTVDKYAPGTVVKVHYKPNKPQRAVLELKSTGGCLLNFLGVVFCIIGIVGAIMGTAVGG